MAEQSTFIKIDRNIMRWRWFKNKNTLIVFLWLLIEANVSDHEFEHEIIHRGEVATSFRNIGISTGLTIQEVRTAILHLKSTGEITSRSCNRYQVISITNYRQYQDIQHAKQQRTQQAINRQSTRNQQQYKNIKNDKNVKNIPPKSPTGGQTPSVGIPEMYKDQFKTIDEYLAWRNQ